MSKWFGWFVAAAIGVGWFLASRPDPEAERRANQWQIHAESLAARERREDRTFTDTIRVYYGHRDAARAATDSLLNVPNMGTIVPNSGTCDSLGIRFAFAAQMALRIALERARDDSLLRLQGDRIVTLRGDVREWQNLYDSTAADLRVALRRTRPPRVSVELLAVLPELRPAIAVTAHVTRVLGLEVRGGVAWKP